MTGHLPEHDPWADPAGGWGPPGTADAAPPVDDAAPDSSGPEPPGIMWAGRGVRRAARRPASWLTR